MIAPVRALWWRNSRIIARTRNRPRGSPIAHGRKAVRTQSAILYKTPTRCLLLTPVSTVASRPDHTEKSHCHGLDAHPPRVRARRQRARRRLLRRTRQGRRGAHHHRRLRARCGRVARSRFGRARSPGKTRRASRGHRCGARCRQPDLPADPARRTLRQARWAGQTAGGSGSGSSCQAKDGLGVSAIHLSRAATCSVSS